MLLKFEEDPQTMILRIGDLHQNTNNRNFNYLIIISVSLKVSNYTLHEYLQKELFT